VLYCTVLYCTQSVHMLLTDTRTVTHCTVLYCTVHNLYTCYIQTLGQAHTVLYCIVLYCTQSVHSMLHKYTRPVTHSTVLYCTQSVHNMLHTDNRPDTHSTVLYCTVHKLYTTCYIQTLGQSHTELNSTVLYCTQSVHSMLHTETWPVKHCTVLY